MTIPALLFALACLVAGGVLASIAPSRRSLASIVGTAAAVAGGLLGGVASLRALLAAEVSSARMLWSVPLGELHVGVDPLSSFFLLAIFVVATLCALYGAAYLSSGDSRRAVGPAILAYNTLVAAMAGVVLARDGVLFLFAWEVMTIASFLLVGLEHEKPEVARASYVYLAASHLGTAFLFILFALLAARAGSFDFAALGAITLTPRFAACCFLLALVGFGTKAGLWPLHFWLPMAHPAAPSHVSALMSGAMIELGVYGLLRILGILGMPAPWWGQLLLAIGAASALLGVLGALGARDLKRLLAYSSIENVGIMTLAIGLGIVELCAGHDSIAALAFTGALFHVWNHALFKTVLFQAAGAVLHASHTRDLEALGGLARRMPRTALPFFVAALSASALPPLNGFTSEWVIYLAAFAGVIAERAAMSVAVIALLALVGGLAAATFVRGFGICFLGEPREAAGRFARDASPGLAIPMWIGAALCLAGGVLPVPFFALAARAALGVVPRAQPPLASGLAWVGGCGVLTVGMAAAAALVRSRILRRRDVRRSVTWDCGYAAPSPRMQYTASSFSEPVLEPFVVLTRASITFRRPQGYFPGEARYEEIVDEAGSTALTSLGAFTAEMLSRVTALQLGRIQIYLLYMLITLIAVLLWWMPG